MKIKKSKHVHHESGYTPVVNCKLTSRRLVCGTETDIQEVGRICGLWRDGARTPHQRLLPPHAGSLRTGRIARMM